VLQCRSGRGVVKKISQPLPGLETLIIQTAAQRYTTELSGLLKGKQISIKIIINIGEILSSTVRGNSN
jgi:hypothetical protein